jgi:uncharacterized membrane protein
MKPIPAGSKALDAAGLAALLFCTWLMAGVAVPYFSFRTDIDFLLTKQALISDRIWITAFYLHISSSVVVLLAGGLQFNQRRLRRYPGFHRAVGKLYIGCILLLSAPSGLIMAWKANGGAAAKASFVLLSLLWWMYTFAAYMLIRKGKVKGHLEYMTKSYALTLSAITLRLYTFFMPALLHLRGQEAYVTVAWLSWVPNLLLAELLLGSGLLKVRTGVEAENRK